MRYFMSSPVGEELIPDVSPDDVNPMQYDPCARMPNEENAVPVEFFTLLLDIFPIEKTKPVKKADRVAKKKKKDQKCCAVSCGKPYSDRVHTTAKADGDDRMPGWVFCGTCHRDFYSDCYGIQRKYFKQIEEWSKKKKWICNDCRQKTLPQSNMGVAAAAAASATVVVDEPVRMHDADDFIFD